MAKVEAIVFGVIENKGLPYSVTFTQNGEELPFSAAKMSTPSEIEKGALVKGTHVSVEYTVVPAHDNRIAPEIYITAMAIVRAVAADKSI